MQHLLRNLRRAHSKNANHKMECFEFFLSYHRIFFYNPILSDVTFKDFGNNGMNHTFLELVKVSGMVCLLRDVLEKTCY